MPKSQKHILRARFKLQAGSKTLDTSKALQLIFTLLDGAGGSMKLSPNAKHSAIKRRLKIEQAAEALTSAQGNGVATRHAELNEKKKKEYESLPYDEQQKIDARNDKRATRKRFNRKQPDQTSFIAARKGQRLLYVDHLIWLLSVSHTKPAIMMNLESEELRMRQSILYTVGRICDDEGPQKQNYGHHTRPVISKEAMALIADLVYKQSEVMATELQFFARHANRKIIKSEDVMLCARKHPNLTNLLQKYQRETLTSTSATSTSSKKRRRNFTDLDEIH
ncbi:unnamed protein product [Peronospora effusa]|nr:unnamed protein product [Peronospora effusa]